MEIENPEEFEANSSGLSLLTRWGDCGRGHAL